MNAPSPRAQPTIICVGQAVMDHRFLVAQTPSRPQKYLANGYQALPGGMATGAAIAAARLGANVHLVSRLGDDTNATTLLSILAEESIDTSLTTRVQGCRTAVSAITIDPNGERQVVHATTDAFDRGKPIDLTELPAADAVLVDPRWPTASLAALQWARQRQIPSVLDADIAPPNVLSDLLPHVDWAVFSSDGLDQRFPDGSPQDKLKQAASLGPKYVAVTYGENGVKWLDDNQLQYIAAVDVAANDTTGAGDVFHGALAFGLAVRRQALTKVSRSTADNAMRLLLHFANQVAARKVANGHGILGAPFAADLLSEITALQSQD
jgi:sulfofructose kinase